MRTSTLAELVPFHSARDDRQLREGEEEEDDGAFSDEDDYEEYEELVRSVTRHCGAKRR